MIINILIASIPERKERLNKLTTELFRQIAECNEPLSFNVILHSTKPHSEGGVSIGIKRQQLLDKCPNNGYCMFLDDDDGIAPNYIAELYKGLLAEVDIITFNSLIMMDNWWGVCETKLENIIEEGTPVGIFKRPPFHISAVKTEYAKQETFPDKMYGEDWEFMEKVIKHCKTEYHIPMLLHKYEHSLTVSKAEN